MSLRERRWYPFCCPLIAVVALSGACTPGTEAEPAPAIASYREREQPAVDADAGCATPMDRAQATEPGQAGAPSTGDSKTGALDACAQDNGGCDKLVSCSTDEGVARCGACPKGYDDVHGD